MTFMKGGFTPGLLLECIIFSIVYLINCQLSVYHLILDLFPSSMNLIF